LYRLAARSAEARRKHAMRTRKSAKTTARDVDETRH